MLKNGEAVLVIRNDRLGDTILSLPVVDLLSKNFPGSPILFCCAPPIAPFIECVDAVNAVIPADDSDYTGLRSGIANKDLAVAIFLRPTLQNATAIWKGKIPIRIGTSRRLYSPLFTHKLNVSRQSSSLHETDLNLKLLEPFSLTGTPHFPSITLPEPSFQKAELLLEGIRGNDSERFVILHPGSGGSAKDWPVAYFKELADRLAERNIAVIVTGSAHERNKCNVVAGDSHLNLCNKTDLLVLAAIISRSDMLISNSTGPLHLAVSLDKKVLGLFPPVKNCLPARWGPWRHPEWALTPDMSLCSECKLGEISSCYCMESLSPDLVLERSYSILYG